MCVASHPDSIVYRTGCSIHNGMLDAEGRCGWCMAEVLYNTFYLSIPHVSKRGSPQTS
jgi:hypothetical protein